MAELPQVVPGEPIQSTTFGNPVLDRVISRYPDATARDFAVPLPQAGDPAYLTSTDELQVYDGTTWQNYVTEAAIEAVTGPVAYDWEAGSIPCNSQQKTLVASLTAPAKPGIYIIGYTTTWRLIAGSGGFSFRTTIDIDNVEVQDFLAGLWDDAQYSLPIAYRYPYALAGGELVEIWALNTDPGQSSQFDRMLEVKWVAP